VIVNEMDLASQALDVTPWRPEAYEQARARLRGAMAEAGPQPEAAPVPAVTPLRGRGFSRAGSRRRGTFGTRGKIGIGAGISAVAVTAAVALVATSTPQPAAPTRSTSRAPAVTSPLMTLAARISASDDGPLPGNASLVIADKTLGGKLVEVVYALYTDNGDMYLGDDKQTLMSEVANHENQADSTNAREIAAARYAATGDLAVARVRMVDSFPNDFFLSYAARKKIWEKNLPALRALLREKGAKGSALNPTMPTGAALQNEINNDLWTASYTALSWAGADPKIREGVLRLISTIPGITVENSTTDGQPTLAITAGPALLGGGNQVVTVNARTGLPISSVESGGGLSTAGETDRDSRVTLASIEAGKF
jgi:hypothetical protein